MRKTVKDPAQGAVGKAEDVPDPSTAPSALPVSGGDYEYYEETAEYERNRADSGPVSGLTIFSSVPAQWEKRSRIPRRLQ